MRTYNQVLKAQITNIYGKNFHLQGKTNFGLSKALIMENEQKNI